MLLKKILNSNVGIIGLGFVGKAVYRGYTRLKIEDMSTYDINGTGNCQTVEDLIERNNYIFICVPTPMVDETPNFEIVKEVCLKIEEIAEDRRVIIKSTVLPSYLIKLEKLLVKNNLIYNPEFLTQRTADYDFLHPTRMVFGCNKKDILDEVTEVLGTDFFKCPVYKMKLTTAAFSKYTSNVFGFLKVVFFNLIYNAIFDEEEYEQIIKSVIDSGWVAPMHTRVPGPDGKFGVGGACIVPETGIYTNNGIIEAKKINIGDLVLTDKGRYRKVIEKFSREVSEEIVEIGIQGFNKVRLTKEHPVLAMKANRKICGIKRRKLTNFKGKKIELDWIKAGDISKGDFVCLPINHKETGSKLNISDDIARLCGYWAAEGSLDKGKKLNKNRITLSFHEKEKEYHKDIIKIVKKELSKEVRINNRKYSKCVVLRFSDKYMSDFLEKHIGCLAGNKKLSEDFFNSKDSILRNFLIGYFRGDRSKSCNIYTCATISKNLFRQLKSILFKFGIPFSTNINKSHIGKDGVKHKESYYIRIKEKRAINKFSLLIEDKKGINKDLKLNKNTYHILDDKLILTVKDIKYINYEGEVLNFEVEEDNTYVVEDFVVHNCLPKETNALIQELKMMGIEGYKILEEAFEYNKKIRND
jgi:UDPglucose 6-dehydrogenase